MTPLQTLKAAVAKPGRKIVVIGSNNCWGSGETGKQAHNHASRPIYWMAWDVPEKTYVAGLGELALDGEDNPEHLTAAQAFIKIAEKLPKKSKAK